jgi:hypothetical protein
MRRIEGAMSRSDAALRLIRINCLLKSVKVAPGFGDFVLILCRFLRFSPLNQDFAERPD